MSLINRRKGSHLDLCATGPVEFRGKGTLFDQVELMHDALPELALDEIDLSTMLLQKQLKAPLIISAMTGGVERAVAINRDLATVAEAYGIGFGFGSMRPLLEDSKALGYHIRDVAPTALVIGNMGVVQASQTSTQQLADIAGQTGCDALAIHLNPSQELVQPEGDRDFRGGLDTIGRLVEELSVPVVVKETGAGISRSVAERLVSVGVKHIDISGAGGTSWVGVETLRAEDELKSSGEALWDWGIPTAASVAMLQGLDVEIIATGGIHDGLDATKALALGATAAGMARPFLIAHHHNGLSGAQVLAEQVIQLMTKTLLLTGSKDAVALRKKPKVLGPLLRAWLRYPA